MCKQPFAYLENYSLVIIAICLYEHQFQSALGEDFAIVQIVSWSDLDLERLYYHLLDQLYKARVHRLAQQYTAMD